MNSFLIIGIVIFVLTNIDTLVVVIAFSLDEDYRLFEILIGHFIGFTVGLLGSVFLTLLATRLLLQWTFLIGVIPLSLGVWGLVRRKSTSTNAAIEILPKTTGRITVVTLAAIGINGENMAVNVPYFSGLLFEQLLVIMVVYLLGAVLVFIFAVVIARRTTEITYPDWFSDWLVPVVLITIGGYVLISGYLAIS